MNKRIKIANIRRNYMENTYNILFKIKDRYKLVEFKGSDAITFPCDKRYHSDLEAFLENKIDVVWYEEKAYKLTKIESADKIEDGVLPYNLYRADEYNKHNLVNYYPDYDESMIIYYDNDWEHPRVYYEKIGIENFDNSNYVKLSKPLYENYRNDLNIFYMVNKNCKESEFDGWVERENGTT